MGEIRLMGLAFLGAGALLLAIGAFFFTRTRRFLRNAVEAQGTVIDLVARSGDEGGTVYSPVVQFTTPEGQAGTITSNVASNPPRHQVGDTVPVKYLPGNPQSARLATKFSLWFVPVLLGGLGAVFFITGGVLALAGGGSGSGDSDAASTVSSPFPVTSISPGATPTVVASIAPAGPPSAATLLNVQEGPGAVRQVNGTCAAFQVRKDGKVREVQLTFEGGTLTFIAKPYTGPGAYIPGRNLTVKSTVFAGEAGSVSGAIVFDATEKAGAVNLSTGPRFVSGSWDCSTVAE